MQRPAEMDWSKPKCIGDIPSRRSGHSLVIVGENAYLFGGKEHKRPPGPNDELYKLDMSSSNEFYWSKIESSGRHPEARSNHTATVVFNTKILLFGGFRSSSIRYNDVWILDTATDEWSQPHAGITETREGGEVVYKRPWPNVPLPRGGHSVSLIGNQLYVFGGYGGAGFARRDFNDVTCLDISRDGPTQTWYFTEINARYPGSVSERLTMMEVTRPTNYANIMNLELYAIRDKTFHGHTLWKEPSNLYWSRRRILADADFELSEKAVKNIAAILYEKCNLILHTDVNSAVPLFKSIYDQECNNNTENEGITTINHTQHAFTNIDDVTNTTTTTTNTNSNNNNKPRVPQAAAGLYGFLEGGISCKQDATLGKLVVAASNYEDREFVLDVLEKAIHLVIPCISYG